MKVKRSCKSWLSGAVIGIISCLFLTGMLSVLLIREVISEEKADIMVLALISISAFAAVFGAMKLSDSKVCYTLGMTPGILLLFMVVGCTLIDGKCIGVPIKVLSLLLGSTVSCVLCMKKRNSYRKRKRGNR